MGNGNLFFLRSPQQSSKKAGQVPILEQIPEEPFRVSLLERPKTKADGWFSRGKKTEATSNWDMILVSIVESTHQKNTGSAMSQETIGSESQTGQRGPSQWLPQTMLLLGTDASGKNHVASLWTKRLRAQGCQVEVRESRLCGAIAERDDHGDKSRLSHMAEQGFLLLFPLVKWMIPPAMALLLHWDARRFKPPGKNLLVVSHNPLRILAFTLGQNKRYLKNQTLPHGLKGP